MEELKHYDIAETTYDIVKEIAIKTAKGFDNAIFMTIKSIAKENGIEMEVVLNETAIVNALKKQIPLKPIGRHTSYKCPVCDRRVRSGKGSSSRGVDHFCQRCGQAIDWSDTE